MSLPYFDSAIVPVVSISASVSVDSWARSAGAPSSSTRTGALGAWPSWASSSVRAASSTSPASAAIVPSSPGACWITKWPPAEGALTKPVVTRAARLASIRVWPTLPPSASSASPSSPASAAS
jgi:hypothetical protein